MDKGREAMGTHSPIADTPQQQQQFQNSHISQVFNPILKPHIYHESPALHTPPHEHHTPPPYTLNPPQPIHQYHQYQFQHSPNHYQINPPPPLQFQNQYHATAYMNSSPGQPPPHQIPTAHQTPPFNPQPYNPNYQQPHYYQPNEPPMNYQNPYHSMHPNQFPPYLQPDKQFIHQPQHVPFMDHTTGQPPPYQGPQNPPNFTNNHPFYQPHYFPQQPSQPPWNGQNQYYHNHHYQPPPMTLQPPYQAHQKDNIKHLHSPCLSPANCLIKVQGEGTKKLVKEFVDGWLEGNHRHELEAMNNDGKWSDQGTMHVTLDHLERSEELGLLVIDKEDKGTPTVNLKEMELEKHSREPDYVSLEGCIEKLVDKEEQLEGKDGKQMNVWEAHKALIQAVLKLPSGELVTGSSDTTLKLWKGKACIHTSIRHTDTVCGLAVIPGLGILSASHDGSIRLWDIDGEKTILVFDPGGRTLSHCRKAISWIGYIKV